MQVRELGMKVFRQHPALVGQALAGAGSLPALACLPAGSCGVCLVQGLVIALVRGYSGPVHECPQRGLACGGSVLTLPTALSQPSSLLLTENHWRLQAQERGAIRAAEPQVDQVAAEVVLPMLLWEGLPRPQPGLPVRGGCQPGGPETGTQYCSPHKGEGTAAGISSWGGFCELLRSSACILSCGTADLGDVGLRALY